jgi:uncharacterized protein YecT (DUF1311 family)
MKPIFAALLVSICCASGAFAAGSNPTECPDGNQADLTRCTGQQVGAAEAEMNDLLAQIAAKVDGQGQAWLTEAQAAWAAYRDKECVFRSGGGIQAAGSIRPMLVNECLRDVTRERIEALRKQVDCPGGNLAC